MNAPLTCVIARICTANGVVVGTGFLVSQKHILTCSHVVNAAFSQPLTAIEPPTGEVCLNFHLLAPHQILKARIVQWIPIPSPLSTTDYADIAVLELLTEPDKSAKPLRLVTADNLWGHRFQVLGFPVGHEDGVWAAGELRQAVGGGRVQIEVIQQSGYRIESGFSGSPVWDEQLDGVVGMTVTAEKSPKRPDVKAAFIIPTSQLLQAFPQLREQAIFPCPYRGLFAFREEDAQYFFGREEFTRKLLAAVQTKPLIAVIGASGSGKSSVVFAGLISQLRSQPNWVIDSFRPGDRPLHNLATKLVPLLSGELSETNRLIEINTLAQALRKFDVSLRDVVGRILEKKAGTRLLLVADQFEELYTLCRDPEEKNCFIEQILGVFNQQLDFSLVLTLRADFLGYVLTHRGLADALQDADVKLGPMNHQELEDAIAKPAMNLVQLEEGLSERILAAVEKQPGNLPLLEFALEQLWKKQHRGYLTHDAYDEIGGVEKALAGYAQEVYEQLNNTDKVKVQQIFIQLVQPGAGTEDTKKLATQKEVGQENWDLVTKLANSRLVVTGLHETSGEETVEIVHEALIREWRTLRQWIEQNRTFRTWQERLRVMQRQWEASGKDDGALLRGFLLDEAQTWQQQRLKELSIEDQEFIDLSLALRDKEKQQQQEIRERELLLTKQSQTRLRLLVMILGAIAIFTTSILSYPRIKKWRAASLAPLINIQEAEITIGTKDNSLNSDTKPQPKVKVHMFQMEKYEVSNRQYRWCVEVRFCSEPITELLDYFDDKNLDYPVVGITAVQAAKYCKWLGRRLPTEIEWERVARDTRYADLSQKQENKNNIEPVKQNVPGESKNQDQVDNLGGNVREWTASYYDGYPNPERQKVWDGNIKSLVYDKPLSVRGGSYKNSIPIVEVRVEARGLDTSHKRFGMRCAK